MNDALGDRLKEELQAEWSQFLIFALLDKIEDPGDHLLKFIKPLFVRHPKTQSRTHY